MPTPRLRVIAGPNGSGKSTLLDYLATRSATGEFSLGHVLNPDAVERQLASTGSADISAWTAGIDEQEFAAFVGAHALAGHMPKDLPLVSGTTIKTRSKEPLGYFIPVLADFLRQHWLASGASFTFETVMSGADKPLLFADAKKAGYRTYLYYIATESVTINKSRIENRVTLGGHPVPEDKIESRYERSLDQVASIIRVFDRAYIFDNSGREHVLVAEFEGGSLKSATTSQPSWVVERILMPLGDL